MGSFFEVAWQVDDTPIIQHRVLLGFTVLFAYPTPGIFEPAEQ